MTGGPATNGATVLLGAYDAKRCARRVHNEWDPTVPKGEWVLPAPIQLRVEAGLVHEQDVLGRLRAALGPDRYVDVSAADGRTAAVEATVAAMRSGAEVVIGGWLPDDVDGGRKGRPDLLVRVGAGYVPGEVKAHLMTRAARKGALTWSGPAAPAVTGVLAGRAMRVSQRADDFLQLAHYWRMLQACGHAADSACGFVIGTDALPEIDPSGMVLVWHDLDRPAFTTYSRSRGSARRSALERYDHEHDFRVRVAGVAAARTGGADDPEPLVVPVFTDECTSCPWLDLCLTDAPDAASAQITSGTLSRREWLVLDRLGHASLASLASLDPTDEAFLADYLPEVTHLPDAPDRLAGVVRRARMIRDGVEMERIGTGPIPVPRAEVEVDFDLEWGVDQRVYLWGALVHHGGSSQYRPIVSWEVVDEAGERALAGQFVAWLRELLAEARSRGERVLVYHYSPVEATQLKRVLGTTAVADLLPLFVDLHKLVSAHYFGAHGLGIKRVAPAFGFHWRDDDPGGLQSQLWLEEARADGADGARARRRLLDYNEDDVRATAAVRTGLSQSPSTHR
ncbi:TM0106 family RecB-like putative nuclease [Nocardioides terrisoli]|uniref:TM0106 family RecB-like putative nuclease n=1 Tax=Nocardioides terrisoli TaxID=3388267 RepID=UPI00287BBD04|nr:TM0106 family RecB-like putative nuclease [Nocardioides marmorisolisilvae]